MVRDLSVLIKEDPVLYLTFNQNITDYSQYNNVTSSVNVTYETDPKGNQQLAASFNGSSSFVSVENADWLNFDLALTLSGWIYSQHNIGGEAYPISHGNWNNRWKVSLGDDLLRFTMKTDEGVYDLDSKTLIEQEKWYFFTAVYTGTDMELYIDGQLDAFIPASGTINSTSYDLMFGKARPDQDYYFKGRLDDVYLFDHAIAPSDILEMYEIGVACIEENNADDLICIFPNPTFRDIIVRIELDFGKHCSYQLFNNSGRRVMAESCQNKAGQDFIIKMNGVIPGVYFLQIKSSKYSVCKKVVILK